MDLAQLSNYCLGLPGAYEDFPFGEKVLVFKVGGKMFALVDVPDAESINLKCMPEKATELRRLYPKNVLPGYHMNKKHWNTVNLDGLIPDDLIKAWIKEAYNLVVAKLPKKCVKIWTCDSCVGIRFLVETLFCFLRVKSEFLLYGAFMPKLKQKKNATFN